MKQIPVTALKQHVGKRTNCHLHYVVKSQSC